MAQKSQTRVFQFFGHVQGGSCDLCGHSFESSETYLASTLEHMVNAHQGQVNHIGPETITGPDGKPWHSTTALVTVVAAKTQARPTQVRAFFMG